VAASGGVLSGFVVCAGWGGGWSIGMAAVAASEGLLVVCRCCGALRAALAGCWGILGWARRLIRIRDEGGDRVMGW